MNTGISFPANSSSGPSDTSANAINGTAIGQAARGRQITPSMLSARAIQPSATLLPCGLKVAIFTRAGSKSDTRSTELWTLVSSDGIIKSRRSIARGSSPTIAAKAARP